MSAAERTFVGKQHRSGWFSLQLLHGEQYGR